MKCGTTLRKTAVSKTVTFRDKKKNGTYKNVNTFLSFKKFRDQNKP